MIAVAHVVDGYVLSPLVLKEATHLHPVVVLLVVLVGADLFGFWGVLAAIPVAGIVQLALRQWVLPRLGALGSPSVRRRRACERGEGGAGRMCRALKVLCAAPGTDSLRALKGAAVSVSWELVGGATTVDELVRQLDDHSPDVVVVDAALPGVEVGAIRQAAPRARVISLGTLDGADGVAHTPERVRDAILGLPPVGGPVRR